MMAKFNVLINQRNLPNERKILVIAADFLPKNIFSIFAL